MKDVSVDTIKPGMVSVYSQLTPKNPLRGGATLRSKMASQLRSMD